ncbi:MAG TPA: class I SAM-dependent methyltransferase [Thermoleophilia bacterium]|nr:class I SAM-dependent methyltransferase [Thermoleophilia bacterium]
MAASVAIRAEETLARNEEEIRRLAAADARSWWVRGRRLLVASVLRQHLKDHVAGPVADLGCGAGGMLPVLGEHGPVVGVDLSPLAMDFCRLKGYRGLAIGALEALPLLPESVALIGITDVLEHVEDDAQVLRECASALKPGGTILITVPALPWLYSEHDRALGHLRRYSRSQLTELLENSGLKVKRLTYFNALVLPVVILARTLRRSNRAYPRADSLEFPGPLNWLLFQVLAAESGLVRVADFPVGLSLLAVARKTANIARVTRTSVRQGGSL